jgi:hypothetical protein
MRVKEPRWCNWPNRDYQRATTDLFQVGARCDAWRAFLSSDTMKRLNRVKGRIIWFNQYEYFDTLLAEFDCSEATLRKVIREILLPEFRDNAFAFRRKDIFDARAWATVPLNWFTQGLDGFQQRKDDRRRFQNEVLEACEVPKVQFAIKLPWDVTSDYFTLKHRLKNGQRVAELLFDHPELDPRFQGRRWVADGVFPTATSRAEMLKALFRQAEEKCANHQVRIIDRWTLRELNNDPHPCTAT